MFEHTRYRVSGHMTEQPRKEKFVVTSDGCSDHRNGRPAEHDPPSEQTTEAVGRASEAWEYVERARGHLFSLHQLIGRADILFEEAADLFDACGHHDLAETFNKEIVGRNVLDGRWTFQIVDEFDGLYYRTVVGAVRDAEAKFHGGQPHVFEAEMKERRRTHGRAGHEIRPPAAHDPRLAVDSAD